MASPAGHVPTKSHWSPSVPDAWTSVTSGNWASATNWSAGAPNAGSDVAIALAGSYTVTIDAAQIANYLTLNSSGVTLALAASGALNVTGSVSLIRGTLSLAGGAALTAATIGLATTATLTAGAGGGTSTIAAVFNNLGSVRIGAGTLALTNGGSLGGSITGAGVLSLAGGVFTGAAATYSMPDLAIANASLAVTGPGTLTGGLAVAGQGTLSIRSGVTLTVASPILLGLPGANYNGAATLLGAGTLTTTALTTIAGDAGQTELALGGALIWNNTGTINDGGAIGLNLVTNDRVTILNQAGAVFNLLNDNAGFNTINAGNDSFINSGTLTKSGGAGTSVFGAALTSTGLVSVATGTLQLDGGGALVGTLSGAGALELSAGNFAEQGASFALASLTIDNAATLTIAGTDTLSQSIAVNGFGSLAVAGGLSATLAGPLGFSLPGGGGGAAGFLLGGGTLTTTGTTTVNDNGSQAALNLGRFITWLNAGIVLDSGAIALNVVSGDKVTLINQAGASFNLLSDHAGLSITGTGVDRFSNAGTLAKTGGASTSVIAAVFTDTGRIEVASGTLQLTASSTLGGTLAGTGVLELSGNQVVEQGGLAGSGNLMIDNAATLTILAADTLTPTIGVSGLGTLSVATGVSATIAGGLSFGRSGAPFNGAGNLLGLGTLTTTGTTTINDNGAQAALILGRVITWVNWGIVQDAGSVALTLGAVDRVTIVNQAGANFNLLSDTANLVLANAGKANFANAGTLAKLGGFGISIIEAALTSTGLINVAAGTLRLDAGGTLAGALTGAGMLELAVSAFAEQGGLTGHGTVAIDNGAVLNILASDIVAPSIALTGAGTLAVAAGFTATLAGSLGIGLSGGLFNGAGALAGPGTLVTAGAVTIAAATGQTELALGHSLTWVNAGTVQDNGIIAMNFALNDRATIVNQAGAVFNLTTDAAGLSLTSAGNDSFSNAGTLAKTGGAGTSVIAAVLTSTGLINVATGTLQLTGTGTLAGVLNGDGTLELSGGPFNEQGNLLGSGFLSLDNASIMTITAAGTISPAIAVTANSTLALPGGIAATITGPLNLGVATLFGGGTLTTAGVTTIADIPGTIGLSLGHNLDWLNAGIVQESGGINLNVVANDRVYLANSSSGVFNLLDDHAGLFVTNSGVDRFTNAGTFAKTGGSGTSTIAAVFISNGLIDVASGTLQLNATSNLAGTLAGPGLLELSAASSIEQGGLTGSGNMAINNNATLTIAGNDTINPTIGVDTNGALVLANSVSALLTGRLSFGLTGGGASTGGSLLGLGTLTTTGTTTIANSGTQAALTLGHLMTWVNAGTVQDSGLTAMNVGGSDRVSVINQAGATFNLLSDSAGFTPLTVGLDHFANLGTLAKAGGTGDSVLAMTFVNTGLVNVANGTLLLIGGGTLAGTLAGSGTLELGTSAFAEQGGLAGQGTLAIDGAAMLTILAADTLSPTVALNGLGTLAVATGIDASLSGPLIIGRAGAAYNGTANFAGPGTLTTSGITTIVDSSSQVELSLGRALTWINTGTIQDNGVVLLNFSANDKVSLINQAGAVFNLGSDDAGLSGTLAGNDSMINAGTLAKIGGGGTSVINATLTNIGVIDVATGTLQLNGPGALSGTLNGDGTLELSGGPFTEQGGLLGGGTITIDNGSVLAVNGNDTLTPAILVLANGRLTLAAGISATLTGALGFGSAAGAGNLYGPGTLTTAGVTTITDLPSGPALNLGHNINWLNAGIVQDSGNIALNVVASDRVFILNQAGASFDLLTNSAGLAVTSAGNDSFTNAGTLAKTGGLATSTIATSFSSTGLINVASGTLQLIAGAALGGTLSGAGVLELNGDLVTEQGGLLGGGNLTVDNAATLTIAGNDTLNPSVAIDGGATLIMAAGIAATFKGAVSFGAGNNAGNLLGPGTLTTTGTTTLSANPGQVAMTLTRFVTWLNAGIVQDGGAATMNVGGSDRITIVNQAGAVFNLLNDTAGFTPLVAGKDSMTNNGMLAKTGGVGTSTITATIDSTGRIDVQTGTLAFNGGGTLSGLLTGAGVLDLGSTPFVADASLAIAGTLLLHSGGGLNIIVSASLTGTAIISGNATLALAAGTSLAGSGALILGQPIGQYDGAAVLSGLGTLATAGVTTITDTPGQIALTLGGGMTWMNSGTINDSGAATLNFAAGDAVSLVNQAGAILNLLTDDAGFAALNPGTDTLINAGTLEKTGGASVSLIAAAINNTGVISVQAGTLELDGGGMLGGSLRGTGVLGLGFGGFTGAPAVLGGGNLLIHNSATLTLTASGTLTGLDQINGSSTLSLSAGSQITSAGTLTLGSASGYGALAGPGTLTTSGPTRINDNSSGRQLDLGNHISWRNAGAIADSGAIYLGLVNNDAVQLVNQVNGVFSLLTDDAGIAGFTQGTYSLTNAGLFSKTGGAGVSNVFINMTNSGTFSAASGTLRLISTVTNTGTLLARNGATLDLSFANLLNLSNNTISRGSYEAGAGSTLLLASPARLTTDAARITLSGAGSVLAVLDTTTGNQISLENSLSAIAAAGTLALSAGRIFNETAANFNVSGGLSLAGGSFGGSAVAIAGTVSGFGTVQGALTDTGSIAASGGTLTLAGSLTGTGSLSARASSTLVLATGGILTETISGPGSLELASGSYTLAAASTLATGSVLVDGAAQLSGPSTGTTTISAVLTNLGLISSGLGKIVFLSAFNNSGTLVAGGGSLSFSARIAGAGQLAIGNAGTANLLNGASTGQTADFLASTGLLNLGGPASFAGTIAGFGASDQIDLLNTAASTLNFSAGALKVFNGNTQVASLAFSGNYTTASFGLGPDNQGGVLITFRG